MSAEILRQAASLMRERAGDAIDGTGSSDWFANDFRVRSSGGHVCDASSFEAPHIASWHPGLALAVADWLDHEAEVHECLQANGARGLRVDGQVPNAFSVARAYLGDDE